MVHAGALACLGGGGGGGRRESYAGLSDANVWRQNLIGAFYGWLFQSLTTSSGLT